MTPGPELGGLAALVIEDMFLAPAGFRPLTPGDARDVIVGLGDIHRAERGEGLVLRQITAEGCLHHETIRIQMHDAQATLAAIAEGEGEFLLLRIERDLLQRHHRASLMGNGANHETGAIGRPPEMAGREWARAPIAIGRINHEHFLGALVHAHPELDEVQAVLHPIADPHRHGRRAPEGRKHMTHDPHRGRFIERHLARFAGDKSRIARHVASGPIRQEAVLAQHADIARLDRLDLEAPDIRVGEADIDIVLLRTNFGLGEVLDLDGHFIFGGSEHGASGGLLGRERRGEKGEGERSLNDRESHRHPPNWLHAARSGYAWPSPPRKSLAQSRTSDSPPARY